jgi:hypothetical protein
MLALVYTSPSVFGPPPAARFARTRASMNQPEPRVGPPLLHILETEIAEEISLYYPDTEQVVVLNQSAWDV